MHAKIRPAKATAKAVRNIEFSFECGFDLGYYQIQSATERQRFLDLADIARAKQKLGRFLDAVTTGGGFGKIALIACRSLCASESLSTRCDNRASYAGWNVNKRQRPVGATFTENIVPGALFGYRGVQYVSNSVCNCSRDLFCRRCSWGFARSSNLTASAGSSE
jgi:hypothetical protein